MTDSLKTLENILKREFEIFSTIHRIEEEKSEAIINKDGKLLQELSRKQENCLTDIHPLEEKRTKITDSFKTGKKNASTVTLSDILDAGKISDSGLKCIGRDLESVLGKIRNLQDVNNRLIKDNIVFFNTFIDELKKSVTSRTGYTEKGVENGEAVSSILVNKMA